MPPSMNGARVDELQFNKEDVSEGGMPPFKSVRSDSRLIVLQQLFYFTKL